MSSNHCFEIIAGTVSLITANSQFNKALYTQQINWKILLPWYWYNGWTDWKSTSTTFPSCIWELAKVMVLKLNCKAEWSQLLSWKYCRGTILHTKIVVVSVLALLECWVSWRRQVQKHRLWWSQIRIMHVGESNLQLCCDSTGKLSSRNQSIFIIILNFCDQQLKQIFLKSTKYGQLVQLLFP